MKKQKSTVLRLLSLLLSLCVFLSLPLPASGAEELPKRTIFVRETVGIDPNAEYLIVDIVDGVHYALVNASSGTAGAAGVTLVSSKDDFHTVTIDESLVSKCSWKFVPRNVDAVANGVPVKGYYVNNGTAYVRCNSSNVITTDQKQGEVFAVCRSDDTALYSILMSNGGGNKWNDLCMTSATAWGMTGTNVVRNLLLYRKVGGADAPITADTAVLDYGKPMPVNIFSDAEVEGTAALGYVLKAVGFSAYDPAVDPGNYVWPDAFTPELQGRFGTFRVEDNRVIYTPEAFLSSIEKVFCAVKVENASYPDDAYYLYNTLTVVPANQVYYETDEALGFSFSPEGWTPGAAAEDWQDAYQPGNTYGYDSSYTGDAGASGGSSWVAHGAGVSVTTAGFSFTGTGFDLISRTGPEQGTIRITVKAEDGSTVRTVSVMNKGEKELFQIPVACVRGLPYGSYTVTIGVHPAFDYPAYPEASRGNEFYFDAVRVYDPALGDGEAEAAYRADREYAPDIRQVRSLLLAAGDWNAGNTIPDGAVYMDDYSGTWDIAAYEAWGANHEVYLGQNNAIAFRLTGAADCQRLDLAARSADGLPVGLEVTLQSVAAGNSNTVARQIATGTALYYDLRSALPAGDLSGGVYVIVRNTGPGLLSLTDLKLVGNMAVLLDSGTLRAAKFVFAPDRDAVRADFAGENARVLEQPGLTVVTSQMVTRLSVTDPNGLDVPCEASFEDVGEERVWSVAIRPTLLGEQAFTITGYDGNGVSGAPVSGVLNVTY